MATNEAQTFGALLRRHRTAAALSQEDLATRAGLSARGVSDLERGARRAPRLETVRMLADALGLLPAERAALLAARDVGHDESTVPATFSVGGARTLPPTPLTSFVGRQREVAEVSELLRRADVRLVTLTGPGGVGKTRLALRAAEALAPEFADGVVFVDLTPLTDSALVAPAVAGVLGVRETGTRPLVEPVIEALRGRDLLLLLDNFEHVVEAAPLMVSLLSGCPRVNLLVTSREPLHLSAEWIVAVPSLDPPDLNLPLPDLATADAVRLFAQRAQAARADFALTEQNAAAVAAICVRLDGLPLAIELAAARVPHLPPATLLQRLEQRLPLLTGGARDLPERQRTMRDAIAWSHDLLSPEEQALFRRLAVFVGGSTLEAAEAVAGRPTDPSGAVLDGVAALVDKGLLRQENGTDGEPRYRMLETVREYGVEQLMASGEEGAVREGHAAWCLAFAEAVDPLSIASRQPARLAALDIEWPNMQAALGWLLATGGSEAALRLAGALVPVWWVRSRPGEAIAWLQRVLDACPVRERARVHALISLGQFRSGAGDLAGAEAILLEAHRHAVDLGAADLVAWASVRLGQRAEFAGDEAAALAHYQDGLVIARQVGDPFLIGLLLENAGHVHFRRGDLDRTVVCSEEALAVLADAGDRYLSGVALATLAWTDHHRGDSASAARRFDEALTFALELRDPWFVGNALAGLADLALTGGDPIQAGRLLGAAEAQRLQADRPTLPYPTEHDRIAAAIQSALGDPAFATVLAIGRSLSLAEVLAEARVASEAGARSGQEPPAGDVSTRSTP
jgi:predicted ATPase/DNA-binding XRE family transcriptional regulator